MNDFKRGAEHLLLQCGVIRLYIVLQAYRGSVRPFVHFNAKQDADILRKAMKGIGEQAIFILMVKLS